MKKVISFALTIVLLVSFAVSFTSCSRIMFKKVQSVSYQPANSSGTEKLQSSCNIKFNFESISAEEYDNANGNKWETESTGNYFHYYDEYLEQEHCFNSKQTINTDKKVNFFGKDFSPRELEKREGESFFIKFEGNHRKVIILEVEVYYVEIKFVNNDTMELRYYDIMKKETITKRVKTQNYQIIYFN